MRELKGNKFMERLHWKVQTTCNLKCDFCYLWRRPNEKTLDFPTSKKLIDEASQLFNWILLGGGDPLIHPNILQLVLYAKSRRLKVELQTNARVIHREFVPEIFNAIDLLGLSIDGDNPAAHDGFRNAPGNFKQQLIALEIAEKTKVNTIIRTLVTKENIEFIPKIANVLSNYGCIKEWRIRQFIPLESGLKNTNKYMITNCSFLEAVDACFENASKQQVRYKLSTINANQVSRDCCIHINHDGTVFGNPDSTTYESVGCFPNQSLKSLSQKVIQKNRI
jgi:MoaA/NifB/PqqE/SkfB family radical SAM enzyme